MARATHDASGHRLYSRGGGRVISTIELSGPFFTYDPAKTLSENTQVMLAALAEEGEADVKAQVAPHSRSGFYYQGIVGRVVSMKGKRWYRTAIVSQTNIWPWNNKGARGFTGRSEAEYRGGKLEARYHMFRTTTSRLRRSRAVNRAELTKGMN